jgi:hypothetical protein
VGEDSGATLEDEAHWRRFVDFALAELPEIRSRFDDDDLRTRGTVGIFMTLDWVADDDGMPRFTEGDYWARALRVIEVVEEAMEVIAEDPDRESDLANLSAVSTAGLLCQLTRNPAGLEQLLPLMGPLSVQACRDEVALHVVSRGFDGSAVDWSLACSRFQRHPIDPSTILPQA